MKYTYIQRKREKKKICKANGFNCPECIYHDWVFEGIIFRGNRCRLDNTYKFRGDSK